MKRIVRGISSVLLILAVMVLVTRTYGSTSGFFSELHLDNWNIPSYSLSSESHFAHSFMISENETNKDIKDENIGLPSLVNIANFRFQHCVSNFEIGSLAADLLVRTRKTAMVRNILPGYPSIPIALHRLSI